MMSMSRTALFLMALMLAAATAATAATAFAGTGVKFPRPDQAVVEAITASSDAIQRAKIRTLTLRNKTTVAFKAPRIVRR